VKEHIQTEIVLDNELTKKVGMSVMLQRRRRETIEEHSAQPSQEKFPLIIMDTYI
jgi:hypothetical protein